MTPRVSIVMAAKNYARYLPMAVRSVLAQTFADWELIIIDDGSTDNTPEIIDGFRDDPRIRYFRRESLGQSRAKNLGIESATAMLIAFLDADDAWRPNKLQNQFDIMNANPEIGVLVCERDIIAPDYNAVPMPTSSDNPQLELISRDDIFISNPICFSSVMVRRQVFDHVGRFDPDLDLAIDYDLWLRAAAHYRFARLSAKLVLYRTGHANLSSRQADRIATVFTIMNRRRTGVSPRAIAAGYGSTCQSMAWQARKESTVQAIRWYACCFRWPGFRRAALKGIAGTLLSRSLLRA